MSFQQLGGRSVSLEEVAAELQRLPLDGVLGVLAALSLDLLRAGIGFTDPQLQGPLLSRAIADDFPTALPGAPRMLAPGRVPITGGRHVFVHEHNVAWLTNAALLHSSVDAPTPDLTQDLIRRVCRLLLIVNDVLSAQLNPVPHTLEERRQLALNLIRSGQFNTFFDDPLETMRNLERQRVLYEGHLPQHFPGIQDLLKEATGLTTSGYFRLLALITTHLHHRMRAGVHWLSRSTLHKDLKRDRAESERLLAAWTVTPAEYRIRVLGGPGPAALDTAAGTDLVELRRTPVVEARPDELVIPIPTFLLAKMTDGVFYLLTDYLRGDPRQGEFQTAIGHAFEDYAKGLVDRLCVNGFQGQRSPTVDDVELADHFVQRSATGISFEHKALRAQRAFLTGGVGDSMLGPSTALTARIEAGDPSAFKDAHRQDYGIFTRPLWQQTAHGPALIQWAKGQFGTTPTRVFPLFVNLAPFRVNSAVRLIYLEPLRAAAGLLAEPWWEAPQWLQIEDLESLVAFVEQGEDLEALLTHKDQNARFARFDVYLFERFGSRRADETLNDGAMALLLATQDHFFGANQDTAT